MARIAKYLTSVLCAVMVATGCQKSDTGASATGDARATPGTQASEHCAATDAALEATRVDPLFQDPYVDLDEWRDEPVRHRYVHGGFKNTETRFSLYLPPKGQYEGRFFQYITPVPMNEYLSQGASGEEDRIGFSIASGAYFIETNGGGMKAMMEDSTIGAYRANAAVAQYSRVVAMEMYGCERPYGYAFGGSGGGYRTIGGMENTEGVWDGAVPYVIGSPMAIPNVFTVRMYALRVLDDKLPAIADAVDVGSEMKVADLLTEEEYSAFQEVTKMGFPREAWYVHDKLDLHGYASLFPGVVAADPTYFTEDFWNKPGYEGYKPPQSLLDAIVEHPTKIKRLIFARDAEQTGLKAALLDDESRGLADDAWKSLLKNSSSDVPVAIQLDSVPGKDLLGADLLIKTGKAADSSLLITRSAGHFVIVGSKDGDALARLAAGDKVEINNRNFLASQTYHRHQVPPEGYPVYDQFRDEKGNPIYPQRPVLLAPRIVASAAGSVPDGQFKGRMIVLSNLHDTEAYPWQGDWYLQQAKTHFGKDYNNHIRLWYTDRANHGDVGEQLMPTQTVSYLGVLQQALRDVSAWVERGDAPAQTSGYRIVDGQVELAGSARERRGIQPVVNVTAAGPRSQDSQRVEIKAGESVDITGVIELPPGGGELVAAEWDFDGSGEFATKADLESVKSPGSRVVLTTSHRFAEPGTHFVTLRVAAQRTGDTETPFTRVQNLKRLRVVVHQGPVKK